MCYTCVVPASVLFWCPSVCMPASVGPRLSVWHCVRLRLGVRACVCVRARMVRLSRALDLPVPPLPARPNRSLQTMRKVPLRPCVVPASPKRTLGTRLPGPQKPGCRATHQLPAPSTVTMAMQAPAMVPATSLQRCAPPRDLRAALQPTTPSRVLPRVRVLLFQKAFLFFGVGSQFTTPPVAPTLQLVTVSQVLIFLVHLEGDWENERGR